MLFLESLEPFIENWMAIAFFIDYLTNWSEEQGFDGISRSTAIVPEDAYGLVCYGSEHDIAAKVLCHEPSYCRLSGSGKAKKKSFPLAFLDSPDAPPNGIFLCPG